MYIVLAALILAFGASGIAVIIAVVVESIRTLSSSGAIASIFIQLGVGLMTGALLLLLTVGVVKLTALLLNNTTKFFIRTIKKRTKKEDESHA